MQQYINIYRRLLKINFAELLAYRANFISHLISSCCWTLFQIIWINLLTYKNQSIFGWKKEDLIILTISYVILSGFHHCFLSKNFRELAKIIDYGQLDSYLVKPVDEQFLLSLTKVEYSQLARFLLGTVALIVTLSKFQIYPSLIQILSYIFLMGFGLVTIYSIWLLLSSLMIWYPQINNLVGFLFDLTGVSRYPKEMILKTNNYAIFFFLPITLIAAAPSRYLFNKAITGDTFLLVLECGVLFIISRLFWKFSLRFYTSAS